LHELLPRATPFGVLVNPTNPNAQVSTAEGNAAASAIGGLIRKPSLPAPTGTSIQLLRPRSASIPGALSRVEKPAELPILRPTQFEFVTNLQTAKTIGLDVPATLLAHADDVIE
jgi:putative ABC transport system substrate-binding protein